MLDHLAEAGLSKYDMPEYFASLDVFPLTASGKILKRELVDWVKSGGLSPRSGPLPREVYYGRLNCQSRSTPLTAWLS